MINLTEKRGRQIMTVFHSTVNVQKTEHSVWQTKPNLVRLSNVPISDVWDQPNISEQKPVPNQFQTGFNRFGTEFCVWQTERFCSDFRQSQNRNCSGTKPNLKSKRLDFRRLLYQYFLS